MTTPREHPILFTGPMVRAILDGSKTQTRRVVKTPQQFDYIRPARGGEAPRGTFVAYWHGPDGTEEGGTVRRCPYGVPGDLLYVRETWAAHWGTPPRPVGKVMRSGPVRQHDGTFVEASESQPLYVYYRADDDSRPYDHVPWKPSIHMPKHFSRLWLRVTGVRVERVQDALLRDMEAEGVRPCDQRGTDSLAYGIAMAEAWRDLWDSINAKRGYGWDVNPWVWVVEFEKVER